MRTKIDIYIDVIKDLYIRKGYNSRMIEKEIGIGKTTVERALKKHGLIRSKSDASKLAIKLGRRNIPKRTGPMSESHKRNLLKSRYPNGPKWVCISSKGYRVITVGENVDKEEHILIMENHIGRKLYPGEVVHHINENKTDNRIENLRLMSRADHTRLHNLLRNKLSEEAMFDIFFSDKRVVDISKKYNIDRHKVTKYRKNKELYCKLLKVYNHEC